MVINREKQIHGTFPSRGSYNLINDMPYHSWAFDAFCSCPNIGKNEVGMKILT